LEHFLYFIISYLITLFTAMVLILKNTLLMLTFSSIGEFTRYFYRIERSGTVFQMIVLPARAKELLNTAFLQLGNTVLRYKYIFILVTTKYLHIKMCYKRNVRNIHCVIFEDLTTVIMNTVFWDVMPCVLMQTCQFSGETAASFLVVGHED
jgi:hypothetical protein